MRRSSRTLLVLMLWSCLLVLASALPSSVGQEPAETPKPAPAGEVAKPPVLAPPAEAPETAAPQDASPPAEKPQAQETSKASEEPPPETKPEAEPPEAKKTDEPPKPAPRPALSEEMTALRDRVRQAVAACYRLPFNTRDNTPREIMDLCLAYGHLTEITDASSGQKVNAIGALSWNFSCGGYELFLPYEDGFAPRIGYGTQRQPGEFLAVLAMSMVNPDYEIRVGDRRGTVSDLVEYEKKTCRSGINLAFKLIGLAYYVTEDGATWQNRAGETWSVERLVREELARSANPSTCDVTDRLMGLSFAVHRRVKSKQPVEGVFRQAQDHVRQYQEYALSLQNADGTWHAEFFALKGNSNDLTGTLRATGRTLEWLVFSLPEERLQDPPILRSVVYLANLLGTRAPSWHLSTMTPRDIDAVMHAVRALSIYDQRVFAPFDAEAPSAKAGQTTRASRQPPAKPNPYTADRR